MADAQDSIQFSMPAKNILTQAYDEATRLSHWLVGTEHLLLAVTGERGALADIFVASDLDAERVRAVVRSMRGSAYPMALSDLPGPSSMEVQSIRSATSLAGESGLTPRARAAIDHAVRAARMHGSEVQSPHLMLGLLMVRDGLAVGVLRAIGVDPNHLADQIVELLGSSR